VKTGTAKLTRDAAYCHSRVSWGEIVSAAQSQKEAVKISENVSHRCWCGAGAYIAHVYLSIDAVRALGISIAGRDADTRRERVVSAARSSNFITLYCSNDTPLLARVYVKERCGCCSGWVVKR
jgi:hypothetical protein